jgi:hypothetical protein
VQVAPQSQTKQSSHSSSDLVVTYAPRILPVIRKAISAGIMITLRFSPPFLSVD